MNATSKASRQNSNDFEALKSQLTHLSLLQGAKSGEPTAWHRLMELYRPLIAGWARRHTPGEQDAEDLGQEILAEVVRYLPTFEHNGRPGAFRTWLRTLAVHATSRFSTARAKQPQGTGDSAVLVSLHELAQDDSGLSKVWDQEHDQYVVNRLLQQVALEFEPITIKAFRRQTLDNASADVVAQELNMSIGAVYTAKSRVFLQLRQLSEGLLDWNDESSQPEA